MIEKRMRYEKRISEKNHPVELGAVGSIRTYARSPGGMVLTQYRAIVYVLIGHNDY